MNLYYFKYIYLSDNAALIIHVYQIKIVSIKSLHRHEISKSEFQFKKEKKISKSERGLYFVLSARGVTTKTNMGPISHHISSPLHCPFFASIHSLNWFDFCSSHLFILHCLLTIWQLSSHPTLIEWSVLRVKLLILR